MFKKIFIASDHAGFQLKDNILKKINNFQIKDLGTDSEEKVDYPDFAFKLVSEVNISNKNGGILICGSGNGMAIAANRFKNIRAGLAFNPEIAKLLRQHNNANILTLAGRQIDLDEAKNCFKIFINTSFEGGRHQKRVEKID